MQGITNPSDEVCVPELNGPGSVDCGQQTASAVDCKSREIGPNVESTRRLARSKVNDFRAAHSDYCYSIIRQDSPSNPVPLRCDRHHGNSLKVVPIASPASVEMTSSLPSSLRSIACTVRRRRERLMSSTMVPSSSMTSIR